jgi:hypothetical protein
VTLPPSSGLKDFFLIASIGQCKFWLLEHSVGLILQTTLGGVVAAFRLQQIVRINLEVLSSFSCFS